MVSFKDVKKGDYLGSAEKVRNQQRGGNPGRTHLNIDGDGTR
jgi:hypothetical protein